MALKKNGYKSAFVPSYVPRQPFPRPYNGPSNDSKKSINKYEKPLSPSQHLGMAKKVLAAFTAAAMTPVGRVIIGYIGNGANSLLNNSREHLPFVEKESNKSLLTGNSEDTTKVHYINFHIGYSATRSVIAAENQSGSVKLELTNSLSDAMDTIPRSLLARSFGFNQKSIDFLGPKFYGVISDYERIYGIKKWKPGDNLSQVPYGLLKEEQTHLKIRNSNAYHAIRIKIHLIKPLDEDVDLFYLYSRTFNNSVDQQGGGAIPVMYQISNLQKERNDFMSHILCHPSTSLSMSPSFKIMGKVEKTFSKTLGPGDTLDFKMTHHCGPGIRFDIAKSLLDNATAPGSQPSCYGIVVEALGTPCEGVRFADNSIFQGTSPGFYNYEYRKIIVPVRHNSIVGDAVGLRDFKKTYAIKIHERELLSTRPFNVSIDAIGDRDDSNKTFGVVSVSSEKPVYSKNAATGDRNKPELSIPDIEELIEKIEEIKEINDDDFEEGVEEW